MHEIRSIANDKETAYHSIAQGGGGCMRRLRELGIE